MSRLRGVLVLVDWAGHEAVGVPEGVRLEIGPGERPPVSSRLTRVLARVTWTLAH